MPCALPMDVRHQIALHYDKGEKLTSIAQCFLLSYSTVRGVCKRYRQEGLRGLAPRYFNCGVKPRTGTAALIHRAALWLKRLHPTWGAALIRLQLKGRYRRSTLPGERTLQRWFHRAGLYKARSTFPLPAHPWARRVHDVWQVDANEQLRLGSGERVCYLTAVDEKSGSLLKAFVFPPLPPQ